MWKSSEFCDFNLSWESDHDPNFISTYTVISNDDDWECSEEISVAAASSFITCNRNGHSCSLEISCECKRHHCVHIVGFNVRSQAKTLELYSNTDGYIQTVRGRKTDEDGIFCCTSKFETPMSHINMKFVGLGDRTSVKIFKLHFFLKQNFESKTGSNGSSGMIDISKVKGYLNSMGDSVPEGGTKLLHAVEDYQQTQMCKLGALSSALSSEGGGSSSMLSSLISMVTKSHDTETSADKIPVKELSSELKNNQNNKSQDMQNSSPLTAMLMAMSGSQDLGQGEPKGQGGMFAMLQNICGKVSQLRVAENTAETRAETLQDDQTDIKDLRTQSHPDVGASKDETIPQNLTGSQNEMLQAAIQQTVSQIMQSSEEKILKYVDTRLNTLESNLNKKLDSIIQLLQKKVYTVNNASQDT